MMYFVEVAMKNGNKNHAHMMIEASNLEEVKASIEEVSEWSMAWIHKSYKLGNALIVEENSEFIEK